MKKANLKTILQTLSIEEKLTLLTGANFWESVSLPEYGLTPIVMNDGPYGVRKPTVNEGAGINEETYPATAFPTTSALASSFDGKLLTKMGNTLASECHDLGVDILLGPGVNIKRSPLCGRNFEYFSEDPFVTAKLAGALVSGLQAHGVGATLKHYAVNSQENDRFMTNAIVDPRALEEIYLKAFHDIVRDHKPHAIMCAYNQVNGRHASRSSFLLTKKLREEAGFSGITMSDWGAVVNIKDSTNAGLNLEMPGGHQDIKLLEAGLKDGTLTSEQVDKIITPLLERMIEKRDNPRKKLACDYNKNFEVATKLGEASAVLLKNEDDILPLRKKQKVALLGNFAKNPRYQGSGSSKINPHKLVSVYEAFGANEVEFVYSDGYLEHETTINEELINEAVTVSKDVDVVVICAGLPDSFEAEGYDRPQLNMPESHNELIKRVSAINPNVVVLLSGGAAMTLPWLSSVKGVLLNHLLGGAVGLASFNLLYGLANPSGKLSETYPLSLEASLPGPSFLESESNVLYRESLYVGYRYYDTFNEDVLFPFGYGLSYTKFHTKFIDLVEANDGIEIKVAVSNIGHRAGSEVVGIYIERTHSMLYGPLKELKAFTKVALEAGEKKEVTLKILYRDLEIYHPLRKRWVLENTMYNVYLGLNVKESEHVSEFNVTTGETLNDLVDYKKENAKYYDRKALTVTSSDFTKLFDEELPLFFANRKRPFTIESNISDTTDYALGRLIYKIMISTATSMAGDDVVMQEMARETIKKIPLRTLPALSSGAVTTRQTEGLLRILNGRIFSGAFKYLVKGRKK